MTSSRPLVGIASLLVFGALGDGQARAQDPTPTPGTFALDRLDPTPVGDRFQTVNGATIAGEELPRASLTLDYARSPLVVRSTPVPIVEHELALHASLSLALWERVLLSASLPIVLLNQGHRVVLPGPPERIVRAANTADIGDLDLGARVGVLGSRTRTVGLAVGGNLWLPTGNPTEFTGSPRFHAMPYASVSGTLPWFTYAGHAGVLFQRSQDFADVHMGPEIRFGAAAAFVSKGDRVQVGPEITASVPLGHGGEDAAALASTELLGSIRLRFGNVILGGGFGPGLLRGVGTPSFRALSTIAFAPVGEKDSDRDGIIDLFDACQRVVGQPNDDPARNGCPSDRDGDGILDVTDRCPDEPGVPSDDPRQNGCPVPTDRDRDGIADAVDACPDTPGPSNKDRKKNGCPSDSDGDGIVDAEDACPDVAGVDDADPKKKGCPADSDGDGIADTLDACPTAAGIPSATPAKNGCPPDTDGDGIIDSLDACPHERGPAHPAPERNGCPLTVRFTAAAIELTRALPFDAGSARITRTVEAQLKEIASVLADHPEVHKVLVEGGPGFGALRASAMVRWLSMHGVAPSRLEARLVSSAHTLRFRIVDPVPASPAP